MFLRRFLLLPLLFCIQLVFAADPLTGHQQLMVVTTRHWDDIQGTLQLFERSDDRTPWTPASQLIPVVVGKTGLAWGIGLHPTQNNPLVKVEGDRRSPAGLFALGTAFGFAPLSEMSHLKVDYLQLTPTIEAVDDPASLYYNCIVDSRLFTPDWKSSEKMHEISLYVMGFNIYHNFPNAKPGCGSAIFFHLWRNDHSGTGGCTATDLDHLSSILSWLDKKKAPVLAQLPLSAYCELENAWHLPTLSMTERYGLVNVETIPGVRFDIRYASPNNFMGFKIYPQAACYLRKEVAAALKEVQEELTQMGLGLKVFDGYRPLPVQQAMWDAIQDERYVSNPKVNKGRHTRGTAVDLTLVDANGQELEMPTPFDDFSEKAHSNNPNVSESAKKNRALLKEVMARHHFEQIPTEWWHFDFEGWKDDVRFPSLDVNFDMLD
jgi:D-alanyl-D-alanine dipeptidase/L,D-peptidoglycan transpeptidase YkuD (ErfK/YbiS/YcfS/YnhG family)